MRNFFLHKLNSARPLKLSSIALRNVLINRSESAIGAGIFLICVLVYLLNDRTNLTSSDNVTHTLLAFNWLENHTLNLDAFRNGYLYEGGGIPYYLVEAPNGHLTSRYPPGTAIVTFPIYCLFFVYLKLASLVQSIASGSSVNLVDVTSEAFGTYRREFGKLAATIATALSVVIFYLSVRLKFSHVKVSYSVSLISTFIFAFATGTWVLCSQDLRQHTVSNLLLIAIVLCLLKVERIEGRQQNWLLLVAGFFCGLLPGVRITSAIFSVAIGAYVLYTYRKKTAFFLLGSLSILFHLGWNFYYFGWDNLLVGGYVKHLEERPVSYAFTFEQFKTAALGLTVSPSDGLLVYSPVLLFSVVGAYWVFRLRANRDEKLLLCLTLTCLALYLHFCFYLFWMGGSDSFGSPLLTDTLPILCFLISYFLAKSRHRFNQQITPLFAVFLASLIYSTAIQTLGAFTQTNWGTSPLPIFADKSRVWKWSDSQIERHFRNFLTQISNPIADEKGYAQSLGAAVEQASIVNPQRGNQAIDDSLVVAAKQRRILQTVLQNTGNVPWFGYQTGLSDRGETKIRVQFFQDGKAVKQRGGSVLYVSGAPKPGERAEATGLIVFPAQPGRYRMAFSLFADGISDAEVQDIYSQPVTVKPRSN